MLFLKRITPPAILAAGGAFMELRVLRYYLAVAQEGSVTRAAGAPPLPADPVQAAQRPGGRAGEEALCLRQLQRPADGGGDAPAQTGGGNPGHGGQDGGGMQGPGGGQRRGHPHRRRRVRRRQIPGPADQGGTGAVPAHPGPPVQRRPERPGPAAGPGPAGLRCADGIQRPVPIQLHPPCLARTPGALSCAGTTPWRKRRRSPRRTCWRRP